ncbi:MAG: DUF2007 domain-containing protein [Planctomycetota bacterium]|nr:DUF2007 domain-containing protein [Planctomycetota bacterium]
MSALTSIRSCSDRFEAESLRIRLAEAGIRAVITGTDMETALGLGGAGTMRLVRLEVATENAERATLILAEDEHMARTAGPWICSRCREQNAATFEVCWSCSKRRLDENQQEQTDTFALQAAMAATTTPQTFPSHDSSEETESVNPDQSFFAETDDVSEAILTRDDERIGTLDEDVLRAFRAAVVGAMVFPPLVSFYSLFLLIRLPADAYRKRTLRVALLWILNLVLIASWTGFWISHSP